MDTLQYLFIDPASPIPGAALLSDPEMAARVHSRVEELTCQQNRVMTVGLNHLHTGARVYQWALRQALAELLPEHVGGEGSSETTRDAPHVHQNDAEMI